MTAYRFLPTGMLAVCAASALAQTGGGYMGCNVGPGFECSVMFLHSGEGLGEQRWARAVILWRSAEGMAPRRQAADGQGGVARSRQIYRAAEDSGRSLVGGVGADAPAVTGGRGSRTRDTLFVLGRAFELPVRDSALVIMIEAATDSLGAAPRTVRTRWVPARIDPAFWAKHWTSGDTGFTVMPPPGNTILRDALSRDSTIRAFLARP